MLSLIFRKSQKVLNEDIHTFRRNDHFPPPWEVGLKLLSFFLRKLIECQFENAMSAENRSTNLLKILFIRKNICFSFFKNLSKQMPQRRDNAGGVCDSGMGMFVF